MPNESLDDLTAFTLAILDIVTIDGSRLSSTAKPVQAPPPTIATAAVVGALPQDQQDVYKTMDPAEKLFVENLNNKIQFKHILDRAPVDTDLTLNSLPTAELQMAHIERISGRAISRRLGCSRENVVAAINLDQPPVRRASQRTRVSDPHKAMERSTSSTSSVPSRDVRSSNSSMTWLISWSEDVKARTSLCILRTFSSSGSHNLGCPANIGRKPSRSCSRRIQT